MAEDFLTQIFPMWQACFVLACGAVEGRSFGDRFVTGGTVGQIIPEAAGSNREWKRTNSLRNGSKGVKGFT
jgi:hypothetical protein